MHFAPSQHASGSKSTKLALVIGFHVLLGIGLVKTMDLRTLSPPTEPAPVGLIPTIVPPVTPPPPTALPLDSLPAPAIVVPTLDVPLPTPPLPNQVTTTTTTVTEPALQPPGTPSTQPTNRSVPANDAGPATIRAASMLDGCNKPAYPAQSARNGDAGTVMLALLVGVDGRVTGARVERSSGFRELDRAALAAMALCRFTPAMRGDVAQAGWALVAYDWKLE
jgi:protein TonB